MTTAHDEILDELVRQGCAARDISGHPHGPTEGHADATWTLSPPDTLRGIYFHLHHDADARVYWIFIEEFRGGEGTEEEVFRSRDPREAADALRTWAAWAREPFVKPTTWWERLRAYFGG